MQANIPDMECVGHGETARLSNPGVSRDLLWVLSKRPFHKLKPWPLVPLKMYAFRTKA